MDFKFSKDSGDIEPKDAPNEKKTQKSSLVLLLILLGGFAYLYFFTNLIRNQEPQKPAEAPAPVQKAVKMPLPPRSGEPAGQMPVKPNAPKAAVPASVAVATPADKSGATAAKPAPKPAPAPPASPVPAPTKSNVEPKKVEVAKTTDKKPQPVAAVNKKADNAPAPKVADKKPAMADTKKAADKKALSAGSAKPAASSKTKKAATGPWSLTVGNYVIEEALSADMGRVRKAGFEPIIKPSARKKSAMHRLLVSEFNDRPSASIELNKLKHSTSDAFIIEQKGKFSVFAGSYVNNAAANTEKDRLKAVGFSVTVKRVDVAIPTQSLTVGPFASKKAADAALSKLRAAGINATLSPK